MRVRRFAGQQTVLDQALGRLQCLQHGYVYGYVSQRTAVDAREGANGCNCARAGALVQRRKRSLLAKDWADGVIQTLVFLAFLALDFLMNGLLARQKTPCQSSHQARLLSNIKIILIMSQPVYKL